MNNTGTPQEMYDENERENPEEKGCVEIIAILIMIIFLIWI